MESLPVSAGLREPLPVPRVRARVALPGLLPEPQPVGRRTMEPMKPEVQTQQVL